MRSGAVVIPFPRGREGLVRGTRSHVTWGGEWTRAKVEDRMQHALGRAVCAHAGRYECALGEAVEPADLLGFAQAALDRRDYSILVAWANSQRTGARGFSEWCREAGYNEDAARKRRERATEKLADMLSLAGRLEQTA